MAIALIAAAVLVTSNRRDFPARTLARHGILPCDADGFLCDLAAEGHDLAAVAGRVRARAEAISGRAQPLRPLLKRAGLARLGRVLEREGNG